MSLGFFDEIFFFEPVIADVMTVFAQVCEHPFYRTGAAAKIRSNGFSGTEPVLLDEFEYVAEPPFV